ncbi:MAG: DUF975 family protein [Cytophagales bacterium]|nr:DUF975 family protein [Cytophagales bacterium]
MQYSNQDLVRQAWNILDFKKIIFGILATIIVGMISGIPNSMDPRFGGLVSLLTSGAFGVGMAVFYLNIARGGEPIIEQIFDGFKNYIPALLTSLLMFIIVGIGFVCLIVPGIILGLGLSQTYFILAEDKNIQAVDALKKSWDMMDGYKMKYFLLCLLYFLLILAGLLCFFVGIFVVIPLIQTSNAVFYEKLKAGELYKV